MSALLAIGWFISLYVSVAVVFHTIGWSGLVRMFPEGWRWWQFPVQLLSLAFFAAVVLNHPFK
jgi:hypothetical protein